MFPYMTQYIKKEIYALDNAKDELASLPKNVQKEFGELINEIKEYGYLEYPEGKKLSGYDLFEMRIIDESIYRGIYCYSGDAVIILSFFKKKTQKTPLREIQKALKRKNNLIF